MVGHTLAATRLTGWLAGWRRQLALFAGAYLLYTLGRYVAIGDYRSAVRHADLIVDAEHALGIAVERSTQEALRGTAWLWLLNHLYLAAQLVVVPVSSALAYQGTNHLFELMAELKAAFHLEWDVRALQTFYRQGVRESETLNAREKLKRLRPANSVR